MVLRVYLIGTNSEKRLRISDLLTTEIRKSRFGRFGRPAEPCSHKGGRFGRLWRDSRFICENLKRGEFARAALSQVNLCCQAPDSSSYSLIGNLVFAKMNMKPAVLMKFVFDWTLCFRLCEVCRFQNLVRLKSPIKHILKENISEKVFSLSFK